MGNYLIEEEKYKEAVEVLKSALRNDPTDDETRYNLAFAKDKLDKQDPPPPEDDDKKDDEDKQDQNDEQDQNQDQNEDKGENDGENDDPNQNGDGGNDDKNEGNEDDKKSEDPNEDGKERRIMKINEILPLRAMKRMKRKATLAQMS